MIDYERHDCIRERLCEIAAKNVFGRTSGMKDRDIKIDLGAVQETLMLPLWARAKETEKENPILRDTYAQDIVARIDYDFSKLEALLTDEMHQMSFPVRAYNFDHTISDFLEHNGSGMVVNIGAGLDTTFQRVDNGNVLWVNIDLPDVAALRQKLIPDSEREITIAKSVFDFTWIDDMAQQKKGRSIMFLGAGVFYYFSAQEVETLFRRLAHAYPSAHVVFDSMSWFTAWGTNRTTMKESGMDSSAIIKWHLKKASHLKKWVDTITVIEEYPVLSRVPPQNDWSRKVIWGLKIAGWFCLYNMIHVQL
jgi:O-methyltransferase involved in polyketide biosynthesis